MSWKCDKCKEEFFYKDEVVFLCGDYEIQDEENGGSGDIDLVLCNVCYEGGE